MKILFQKNEFDPKTHLFQDILSIGVLKICQWTLYESPTPHSWPVYVHMKFDRTTTDVNHVTSNRRKIAFAPREHLHTRHRGNQQIPAKIICQTNLTKIHGQAPWWWNTKSCLIKKKSAHENYGMWNRYSLKNKQVWRRIWGARERPEVWCKTLFSMWHQKDGHQFHLADFRPIANIANIPRFYEWSQLKWR